MNGGYHQMSPLGADPSLESLRCWVCHNQNNLLRCSRCRSIYYCGSIHQKQDWQRHRDFCHPLISPDQLQESHTMAVSTPISPHPTDGSNSSPLMPNLGSLSGQNTMNGLNQLTGLQAFSGLNQLVDTNQNRDHRREQLRQNFIVKKLNSYCDLIVRDLNSFGFCVIDDFLDNGSQILSEVVYLYKNGCFKAGQVVNRQVPTHMIRGDHIIWVDGTENYCSNVGFLVQTLDSIVMRCNTMQTDGQLSKYRINRRTKAMIACYPGNNSKYVKHIDNPNNDGRCITCIYYLNKDYNRERDGGILRLFPQITSCVADIEPKFNRVIFFWSDRRNPHEVMPSMRMRFAITVWYFDANERERALQRYKQERINCPVDKDLRPF